MGARTALPLLERSEELELIGAHAAQAAAGSGAIVLVEGPAGIGKTTVLAAARELAPGAGLTVRSARAGRLEYDLPWNLVRQLFADVLAADARQREQLLEGAAALARPALGLGASGDVASALHGLYWLTTALAARAPLLLAADDIQWGDIASLRYLCYLADRIADLPALVVVTSRTGDRRTEWLETLSASAAVERVRLRALSPGASARLTREAVGAGADDTFCAACHGATAGNPFLLNELLGQLQRDRIAPSANSARQVARVTPETVSRAILMRLAALPAGARQLAEAVVVLGDPAPLGEAAALAELDAGQSAQAADALAAADILAPGVPLRFIHPLVREAIYSEIPSHQRAASHARAARLLAARDADPQRVAVQLVESEPTGDEWVVARLQEAAHAALAEGAPELAVEFLRRAVNEPPAPDQRVGVLCQLAGAEALGGSDEAIGHLEQAHGLAGDAVTAAGIGVALVLLRLRGGHMDEALALARELVQRGAISDRLLQMRVIAAAVASAVLVPALRTQTDFFLARIPADIVEDSPEGRLALSARLADAMARRVPMPQVGDLAERIVGGGMLPKEMTAHELLYWNATSALTVAERFQPARRAMDAALRDAGARGSAVGFALCSCFRCGLDHRVGDVAAGVEDGRKALAHAPRDVPQVRAYAAAFLADCLIEQGELDAAIDLLGASEFTENVPELFGYHLLRVARGRALIAAGKADAGVGELLAVGDAMGEGDPGPAVCPWRARAATGLAALGRPGQARVLAEEELTIARRTESAWGQVVALQALALTAGGSAEELLTEAHTLTERRGLALERARCLVLLGAHHRRRGQRHAAADLLRHGLERAAACGALALERRARDELLALGLRPRRRHVGGLESLTASERRVVELAAGGMSNAQIAQALFVSLRTVETHLTHSYQKLGIRSRAELEPLLSAP